ncbi:uncharacterized protein LOC128954691 [Oppia nitens]|uniref:uncharacterized protein LOC128954691 n=1 Tax=Oppia nitens TaxID=1686743 RepID=UPI0023DC56D2|nr:uncharacterized protein LOC128954691 [Oppia nitens]
MTQKNLHEKKSSKNLGDIVVCKAMTDERRGRQYPVPEFRSIFTVRCNPFNNDTKRTAELTKWWSDYALLPADKYRGRVGDAMLQFAAYNFPDCTDWNRYANLVKWFGYLFVWDDHNETQYGDFDRSNRTARPIVDQYIQCIDRLERMFDIKCPDKLSTSATESIDCNSVEAVVVSGDYIPIHTWKPYVLSTYATVEAILTDMNSVQRYRFIDSWRQYLRGQDCENQLIEDKVIDFDIIEKVRIDSSGNWTLFTLIEYSDGLYVPQTEWSDPRIQRLLYLTHLQVVYVNDVYSFEKELYDQKGQLDLMFANLVAYYVLHDKCSIREAMDKTIELVRQLEADFVELAKTVANDPELSFDAKRFVEGLANYMASNYHLSITLDRYNNFN